MSNFIQNIQINNLTRQLNGLATTVSNMQVGGAPTIAGNIDMNNYSLTEVNSIQFNNNTTLEPAGSNLEFNGEAIVLQSDLADYQQNPSSSDLDMNQHNILNINDNLNFKNAGVQGNISFNNYVFEIDRDLSLNDNIIRDVGGIYSNNFFLKEGPNYQQLLQYNEGLYTISSAGSDTRAYINVQLDPAGKAASKFNTNFLNNPITNLTSLTFQNQNTNAQQTLTINSSDNSLVYNNSVVITAANINNYEDNNITSDTNFNNNNLYNVDSLIFSTSDTLTIASSNLQYNGEIVVTAATIGEYLPTIPDNELISSDGVVYTADLSKQFCTRQRTIIENTVLLSSDGALTSAFGVTDVFGSIQNVGSINWSNFSSVFDLSFTIDGWFETPFNEQIEFNVGVRVLTADGSPYFNNDGFGFKIPFSEMTQNIDIGQDKNFITYNATITNNDAFLNATPLVPDYTGDFKVILAFENTNPPEIPILVIINMNATLDITAASQEYDALILDNGQLNLNNVILQNSDGALLWDSNEIITTASFQSQFNPMTVDLSLGSNDITNVGTIRCGAVNPDSINFGGNALNKLAYLDGQLQWQGDAVMIDDGSITYLTTSNTTIKPTSLINIGVGANNFYTFNFTAPSSVLFKGTLLGSGFGLDFVAAYKYDGSTISTLENPNISILFDVAEGGAGTPLGIAGTGMSGDPTITISSSGAALTLSLNCVSTNGSSDTDTLRIKIDVLVNI